ncbi:hypothetical protein I317_05300 [Kwoniella heveanensis CBS 569]|nr:hypothetical protein I317_05300 [Kwoniella heveanensis CBS 569]
MVPFSRRPFDESILTALSLDTSSSPPRQRPFVAIDPSFLSLLTSDPKVLRLAKSDSGKSFAHEAGVWVAATNEVWFTSNLYSEDPKFDENTLKQVKVDNSAVDINSGRVRQLYLPSVRNGNGACPYGKYVLVCDQGAGPDEPSQLTIVDPADPSRFEVLINNYQGRHFNSLNDVTVLPPPTSYSSGDSALSEFSDNPMSTSLPRGSTIWFTDPTYGFEQSFRPAGQLPAMVYALDPHSGHIRAVADGFDHPNGICFSPDGKVCYVTDTGHIHGSGRLDPQRASTIYAFDVVWLGKPCNAGGPSLQNRRLFAFADTGVPDGIKCDVKGNVYAGCGDGIHVWNPYGTLIGKIVLGAADDNMGAGCANFCFVPGGRLVCFAEDRVYLVEGLRFEGALLP